MKTDTRAKTVLIPGSTEGLGREFSKLYAANGYRLVMVDRDMHRLNELADDLQREHGTAVRTIAQDPSTESAPGNIRREIEKGGLRVDELLTRAGFRIYGPFSGQELGKELERICAEYRGRTRPSLTPALTARPSAARKPNFPMGGLS